MTSRVVARVQGFLALFSGDTGEIRSEVREQIDAKVRTAYSQAQSALCAHGHCWLDTAPWLLAPASLRMRLAVTAMIWFAFLSYSSAR
jgi:hypothetical protein